MRTTGLILFIAFLISCNATKQSAKYFNKALKKDSGYVAGAARDLFPCVISSVDTVTKTDTMYDFVEVECPEYSTVKDTVEGEEIVRWVTIPRLVKVPAKTIIRTNTITIRERDSAAIFELIKKKDLLYKDIAKLEKRVKVGGVITWVLSGALLIALAIVFLMIKRK